MKFLYFFPLITFITSFIPLFVSATPESVFEKVFTKLQLFYATVSFALSNPALETTRSSKSPPECTILYRGAFHNFLLADKLFA